MKYFSNLHNGWADLTIGDFTCPCSYIQNVPMEILHLKSLQSGWKSVFLTERKKFD